MTGIPVKSVPMPLHARPITDDDPQRRVPPPSDRPVGAFHAIGDFAVGGWVLDPSRPGHRFAVEIRADGEHLGLVLAESFSAEVRSRFGGDGCHGFTFVLDAEQLGATRVIETTWDAYAHLLTAHTDDANRAKNMPVTCFKLLFWNMTEYAEMVHFDADVLWLGENSDYVFGLSNASSVELVATWELRPQADWVFSFNSHLMRLKPDAGRFKNLVRRMETGEWRPYTNGEQDILNTEFEDEAGYFFGGERDPHGARGFAPAESARVISNEIGILRMPQHWHGNPYAWDWRTGHPFRIDNCVIADGLAGFL